MANVSQLPTPLSPLINLDVITWLKLGIKLAANEIQIYPKNSRLLFNQWETLCLVNGILVQKVTEPTTGDEKHTVIISSTLEITVWLYDCNIRLYPQSMAIKYSHDKDEQ